MINIEIKLIINITDMKDKNHKHRQGGFNCSCLPAGLGGNGEFERKGAHPCTSSSGQGGGKRVLEDFF